MLGLLFPHDSPNNINHALSTFREGARDGGLIFGLIGLGALLIRGEPPSNFTGVQIFGLSMISGCYICGAFEMYRSGVRAGLMARFLALVTSPILAVVALIGLLDNKLRK
jgi:hypothetical protein